MVASVIFYFVSVALIAAVSYKLGVDMTMTKQAQEKSHE